MKECDNKLGLVNERKYLGKKIVLLIRNCSTHFGKTVKTKFKRGEVVRKIG